jgi:hypothetical protein
MSIAKGHKKRRIIYIPTPPLRRLQKLLLKRCLDPALEKELEPFVFGCRPGANHTIFHNAARHIGQRFVARFDLKDFFPSIGIDDVVSALLSIRSPVVTQRSINERPDGQTDVRRTHYPWTHDTAVLVARLATRRGRLPQGAPTSPAIANLVFRKYDRRIVEALGADFVYSRYVDDLTVSLSYAGSRRLPIENESKMRSHVEEILTAALEGSPFSLNHGKTRVSVLEQKPAAPALSRPNTGQGHRITGIRVTSDKVELTRSAKRDIRSLVYNLNKLGFLQVACNRVGGEVAARTSYRADTVSHLREGRRLSTERLGVLMLKKYAPDLRVEVRSPAPCDLRRRGVQDLELCEGRRAWQVIERVLGYLWTGQVSCEDEEGHLSIREHDGRMVCRIRSESRLDFFQLSSREAISCVELWHELRGRVASLTIKDANRCFDPIRGWRQHLADAVERIEIRAVRPPEAGHPLAAAQAGPVTVGPDEEIVALTRLAYHGIEQFFGDIREVLHDIEEANDASQITQHADAFQRAVHGPAELARWISTARQLCVDNLVRFPALPEDEESDREEPPSDIIEVHLPALSPESGKPGSQFGDIFKLLQVLDDRFARRRCHYYRIEERFLNKAARRKYVTDLSTHEDCRKVQAALSQLIGGAFASSQNDKKHYAPARWQAKLRPNLLRVPRATQLDNAFCRFRELHDKCVWQDTGARVFRPDASRELADVTPDLRQCIEAADNRDVWKALFNFGKQICDVTTESLECPAGQESKEVCDRFLQCLEPGSRPAFETFYRLRNRAAHRYRPEHYPDWVAIQNDAAKRLGRPLVKSRRVPNVRLFATGDLQLTRWEGNELKIQHLLAACKALQRFVPTAPPPANY